MTTKGFGKTTSRAVKETSGQNIHTNKATKRVIAPFVKIVRKGEKKSAEKEGESDAAALYLSQPCLVIQQELKSLMGELEQNINLPILLNETGDILKTSTKSTGVMTYIVDTVQGELTLTPRNVTGERSKITWKVGLETTVAAYVAYIKEYILIEDLLSDERFPEGLGYKDELIKSVLCVPIVGSQGECFAIIELYREVNLPPYDMDNLKLAIVVTGWMASAIDQNNARLTLQRQQELNEYLLNLTNLYFSNIIQMEKLLSQVVKFAKVIMGAERGSFYVLDKESDEMLADFYDEGIDEEDLHKKSMKVRLTKERGVASYVAKNGVPINVKDAYNDTRFIREVDFKTGFLSRSILSMPIMSIDGVLGVIQVYNKTNGSSFTKADEDIFKIFSTYCALSLHYFRIRTNIEKTDKLNKCYLKLLKRQMEPCIHDMVDLQENYSTSIPENFDHFAWYPDPSNLDLMVNYSVFMISDIIQRENILMSKLCQFVLMTKKNYQNIPYHNFEHGFVVCHCMYNILKRNPDTFTPLEAKSLIVACLTHDLDHPGLTNNFLMMTENTLAELYEESTLENHHYHITMIILNHCNIYAGVDEIEFKAISKEIKEAILATDLALYFRFRIRLLQLYNDNSLDISVAAHRSLVKSIMMTACDMSGQCKPFDITRRITENVYREFYVQGDIEKKQGLTPLSMMDREKQHMIPDDQVQFLSVVVLPCVDLLRQILPNCGELYENALTLKTCWQEVGADSTRIVIIE